jgi:outer membrane lipopolysaccharide assembly protein LptE/RlpB
LSCLKWKFYLIAGWLCAVLISGCGYAFKQQTGKLPSGITSLAVPILKNRTNELGLENVMTAAIIAEFNRRQKLEVQSVQAADAILEGTIRSIHYEPLSFGRDERAQERRVTLSIDLKLIQRTSGKALWNVSGLSYLNAYKVVQNDPAATEFNKRKALSRVAENLAGKIHDYIFTEF